MRQWIGSVLVQIMTYLLFGAKSLSEPILGYCYLDPRNKLQWNFNQNIKLFIHENAYEKIVCETAAILSMGRWVNIKFANNAVGLLTLVVVDIELMPSNILIIRYHAPKNSREITPVATEVDRCWMAVVDRKISCNMLTQRSFYA